MPALIVIELDVKDAEKLKEYSSKTPPILLEFGGELFLKGRPDVVHDSKGMSGHYGTMVIFQFPTSEKAREWYNSAEYQSLLPLRDQAMDSTFRILG